MTIAETDKPFIDVRTIPPVERHPKIFGMLNALAEGGAFIIVNDHDPRPLHYQLETRYPGEFTWEYLEQGPEGTEPLVSFKSGVRKSVRHFPLSSRSHLAESITLVRLDQSHRDPRVEPPCSQPRYPAGPCPISRPR